MDLGLSGKSVLLIGAGRGLGGAAAVATKTGFGKALIKFIGIGVVALFGAVAAFFRKFARRTA